MAAYITTNQRVITFIRDSGVPRMGKFIPVLISHFFSYGLIMGKLLIGLFVKGQG